MRRPWMKEYFNSIFVKSLCPKRKENQSHSTSHFLGSSSFEDAAADGG